MGDFPKQKHLGAKIFKRHKSWRKGWPCPDSIKEGAIVFPTGKVGREELDTKSKRRQHGQSRETRHSMTLKEMTCP